MIRHSQLKELWLAWFAIQKIINALDRAAILDLSMQCMRWGTGLTTYLTEMCLLYVPRIPTLKYYLYLTPSSQNSLVTTLITRTPLRLYICLTIFSYSSYKESYSILLAHSLGFDTTQKKISPNPLTKLELYCISQETHTNTFKDESLIGRRITVTITNNRQW